MKLAFSDMFNLLCSVCSIHPQGWVPIETQMLLVELLQAHSSIHPQGWVPIETALETPAHPRFYAAVAFTPKGGCLLKREKHRNAHPNPHVAFTPKGGCPLKLNISDLPKQSPLQSSIHPQGWVPIETVAGQGANIHSAARSIHPQGWVPIETLVASALLQRALHQ